MLGLRLELLSFSRTAAHYVGTGPTYFCYSQASCVLLLPVASIFSSLSPIGLLVKGVDCSEKNRNGVFC